MVKPAQSSECVELIEATGSQSFVKKGSFAEDTSFLRSWKETKGLLEQIILKEAMSKDTTDEELEKASNRRRILYAKTTRWRLVFSKWPYPNGKDIPSPAESSALGKMAPNNIEIWGATLFDFYHVKSLPESVDNILLSGSKLAAWMKANGENYAKNQLEFAKNEDDPYLILPYEITELIQDTDRWEDESMGDKKSWIRDEHVNRNRKRKNKEREHWQVPQPWPPASPFDLLAYPKPWPDEPFTREYPKLEKYIMQSHLPTILKVHDPWNRVRVSYFYGMEELNTEEKMKGCQWSEKPDVVRTYRLNTSTTKTARRTEDDRLAEAKEVKRKAVYDAFIADPHSRNEAPPGIIVLPTYQGIDERKPGPAKPHIFVVFPLQPPIPPAREAHLYLSPSQSLGQGNHSFVYSAEYELPRSTFMEDEICHECIKADMFRTLKEQDGPKGEHRDPKWDDENAGCYVMKTCGKPPRKLADEDGVAEFLIQPSTLYSSLEYEGPYRLIYSKIGYQCLERGPYCEHIANSSKGIHPLTAKVRVAAKLSKPYDSHLQEEAEVYQAFPRHFFEHWSGFNVIKPLNVPTPVGPLVPQFYGYYVPDIDPAELEATPESGSFLYGHLRYLSPILLLEDCGQKLEPEKLTLDDQSEAAALVHRFHDAGWIHGSIAKRNVLIQPGPLSYHPLDRNHNRQVRDGLGIGWDFRLIDFGRAYEINKAEGERRIQYLIKDEERDLRRLLDYSY